MARIESLGVFGRFGGFIGIGWYNLPSFWFVCLKTAKNGQNEESVFVWGCRDRGDVG